MPDERFKMRIVAADITIADGRMTGIVETTITRDGNTTRDVQRYGDPLPKPRQPRRKPDAR